MDTLVIYIYPTRQSTHSEKEATKMTEKKVSMRCTVCGACCYSDGTKDCDCDDHDYGRFASGGADE